MSEITDQKSGIRMRLLKEWDITPDPDPHAFTLAVCPICLAQLMGMGASLQASIVDADEKIAAHQCSHLKAQQSETDTPST